MPSITAGRIVPGTGEIVFDQRSITLDESAVGVSLPATSASSPAIFDPSVLLSSPNTWTAIQTFSSILINGTLSGPGINTMLSPYVLSAAPVFSGGISTSGAANLTGGGSLVGTFTGTSTFTGSDIFSGNVSFSGAGGSPITIGANTFSANAMQINGVAGGNRWLQWQTAGSTRWQIGPSGAESGTNAGANLLFSPFSDTGTNLNLGITFVRATGGLTILGPLAANLIASGGTTSRTLANRAADTLNVKDFGAVLDGITNDATALNAARAAATNNQTIWVPAGQIFKTFNPTSGPGSVYWKMDGNTFPSSTQIVSGMGVADVLETNAGGKFLIRGSTNVNNTSPVLRVDSTTTYSGYAAGNVSSALKVNMTGAPGNNAYNWAINTVLFANSTGGANNNQDVAYAATIRRTGSSATWQYYGNTIDSSGYAPNSGSAIVIGEFDISCNGPEGANTNYAPGTGGRAGMHFPVATYQPPAWIASTAYVSIIPASVVQPISPNGYTFVCTTAGTSGVSQPTWPTTPGTTVTDGSVVWTCGTTIATQVSRMFDLGGGTGVSIGAGMFMTADFYNACIDLSWATLTPFSGSAPAAIRLASNMLIDFSANQTLVGQNVRTLGYNSSLTKLQYIKSGSEMFSVTDVGNGAFAGTLQAASFTSIGSGSIVVGSGSNNHIALSPAAFGTAPTITGIGDSGLNLSAQSNKPVKITGGGSVWTGPDVQGFVTSLSGTGTSTGAAPNFNNIIVNESLDRSIVTTQPVTGVNIQHNYGAGTTKGGRTALNVLLLQQAGANTDTGVDNFYVGASIYMYGRYTQPGSSSTTPLGRLFGLNVNCQIQAPFAATNYIQVAGVEVDVGISSGSSATIRSGVAICDLNGAVQGSRSDNALWFYGGGQQWRYGICFSDSQSWPIDTSVGTMFGAKYGAGRNSTPGMQAKWGIDLHQVIFPATGNPYDGGAFRSNNFAVDGAGQVCLGSSYLTPGSTGLAIDAKGSVGVSAVIATAGSNYEPGIIVVGAYGGVWTVPVISNAPAGTVTTLVQPMYPSIPPPANPITVTNFNKSSPGTGLTLTVTWNTTANALTIQPTAGGKLGFNGATPIVKPTGVAVTAAGIHAALTSLGLIAP